MMVSEALLRRNGATMSMPKWHEIMRPVLDALVTASDILTSAELMQITVETFNMTPEERDEHLKSGQLRIYNRMYWAITDLEKAEFLSYGEKRGTYRITDAGKRFIQQHDGPITVSDLMRESPAFRAWKEAYQSAERETKKADEVEEDGDQTNQVPPEEAIERSCAELRTVLADEILQTIAGKDPYSFERLVSRVLIAMGYGEPDGSGAQVTGKSNDEGIDGVIREDKLGFDTIYYQAKRYSAGKCVGRPDLQAFSGALLAKGASKGLFITTGKFSKGAKDYADNLASQKLVLIDGIGLANLMIDYGVGVSTKATYEVKALDSDFFDEL